MLLIIFPRYNCSNKRLKCFGFAWSDHAPLIPTILGCPNEY